MSRKNKLCLGDYCSESNKAVMFVGTVLIIVGLLMLLIGAASNTLGGDLNKIIVAGIGLAITIAGIAVTLSSFDFRMERIYRNKGICTICEKDVPCGSNCTQCVFAAEYMKSKNRHMIGDVIGENNPPKTG